ncbi:penicillin-binding protein activator [Paroceanicella profunda]|uniref:Penicillin-binding protein activator n=1 Tax=Paroceanicella profunda TaxID=2579971 RepID=A0A5B8FIU2_9RHOB|nr:penicillin-binding protein activator [Paroceanicella profunda]QDL93498.1 penicillin-binding protein activator [Paroceanicella profunda]
MTNLRGQIARFVKPGLCALLVAGVAACGSQRPATRSTAAPGGGYGPAVAAGEGAIPMSGPVTVALLVPTGSADPERNAIGQGLVNAAQMAKADLSGTPIDLRVYETGGDATRARSAAERAVSEGASVIVGPLFGASAQAVGPVAARAGLKVLTFSTTPSVAGGNVWLLGQTADTEADRMLSYVSSTGRRSVSVFSPDTPTGQAAATAVRAAAGRHNLQLVQSSSYPRSFRGIQDQAKVFAGGMTADTLVLPDGGQGLASLAAFLAFYGVNPQETKFVGLGQWNSPSTAREASLKGGWFVAPDPDLFNTFATRYQSLYGAPPSPVTSLAYDGIAAVGTLIRDARAAQDPNAFSAEKITDPNGFIGVTGVFRLRSDGMIDRALAVMEVDENGFRVIDPAPRSFGAFGS